jgi:DNA-binding CsgD family transcriptional regulator
VIDSVNECGRTIKLPKYLSGVLRESRKTHAELNTKLGRPPTDEELATASNVDVERVREWRRWNMLPLSLDQSPGSSKDLDGGETLGDVVSVDGGGGRQLQDGMDAMSPMAAAEADADADLLRLALDDALSTLLPRERFVLRHRFGLASASVKALETENDNGTKQPRLPGVTSHKEKQGKDGFMKGDYSIPEAEKVLSKEELGRGATGASVVLLGSLMGVSGETVRTIERRAIAKLKKPSRMGLVVSYVDKQTRHDIETASMGDEQFAQALALAVERADERAGGGRVFGAFAGGAVPVDAADGNAEDGQTLATQKKPQKRPRRRKKPVPKSKDVDAASSETPREAVTVTQTVLEI